MANILDSNALIRTIKRRAFIPRSQETFSDEDFLEMATEEISLEIMEYLIDARGDYLVYQLDVPLVEGQLSYAIPSRAHGSKLRDAAILSPTKDVLFELTQVELSELIDFEKNYTLKNRTKFYLQNNDVVLNSDAIHSGHFIRMWFYMRPSKLVINSRGATISAVSSTFLADDGVTELKTVTFATIPKNFTSNLAYDIVGASSPNKIISYDLVPQSFNLTLKSITFLASAVSGVSVGDYVTQAEETIVPNLPSVFHPIVAQKVAIACLEAMGDEQNKQSAERKLAQMMKSAAKIISNRVEGAQKKIKNRFGPLNSLRKKW